MNLESELFTILKDFGGWGALVVVMVWGGRAFMALARDFAKRVVDRLDRICAAITGQERRVDGLVQRVEEMRGELAEQGKEIAKLAKLSQGAGR